MLSSEPSSCGSVGLDSMEAVPVTGTLNQIKKDLREVIIVCEFFTGKDSASSK